ncbi:ankyrin repeat-containing domain protein [Parachaetomium inaequale]|uniref:Ankyrin repeat-containing domain protein n=1 Tax=Parachaetomium inaequale TaxID=2588326 RepID=A0AAN6PAC0_9PEZI|nr:ankyrin repeat-containing domain protein [Parachaetomium inaequale]
MDVLPDEESTPLDWDKHEAEILDVFVTQDKPLKEVMEHMSNKHGFIATARQYKYRFNRLKKITDEEYLDIDQECQRRAALGKRTDVCLLGRPLAPERVRRGISRAVKNNPQSGRIVKRTSKCELIPNTGSYYGSEHSQAQVKHNETMMLLDLPVATLDMQPSHELIELGDVDLDMAVEAEFGSGKYFSILRGEGVECNCNSANHGGTVATWHGFASDLEASTHLHPRSPLIRAGLSPFRRLDDSDPSVVDFDLSDPYQGRGRMRNLPFFQVLDYPFKVPLPGHRATRGTPELAPIPATTSAGFLIVARSVFQVSDDSGAMEQLLSTVSVADIASQFKQLIPERYDGDLSHKLGGVLDPFQSASSTLPWLFSVAAYLASNNGLTASQMDNLLKWIIDQGHAESLAVFMKIQAPTIHAFAKVLIESAIRIKNVQLLNTLLKCGVKLDSKLYGIAVIGDVDLTKRVLFEADPTCFEKEKGVDMFHHFIQKQHFDLAQFLLDKGVSPDAQSVYSGTALCRAVERGDIAAIEFLLEAGADVNGLDTRRYGVCTTPLGYAVFKKNAEVVVLLLNHGADVGARIEGKSTIAWAALSCRSICELLKERLEPAAVGFLLGDLVDAANRGHDTLVAYIAQQSKGGRTPQLEKALEQSIQGKHLNAAITLLEYGVSPDGSTLSTSPLLTALKQGPKHRVFAELLLKHNADITRPGLLDELASRGPSDLLEAVLASGIDAEHRMNALVTAAGAGNIASAAILIRSGLDVDTPGLPSTPLQEACSQGYENMILFLISKEANVNAPAHPNSGRTALQAALASENPINTAQILLHHGAQASAPPAMLDGLTALEALCHNYYIDDGASLVQLCHKLLDAGATVNGPDGKPSSALHGVIERKWHDVLGRFLEPQHNAILNHIWCDSDGDSGMVDDEEPRGPYTPTQLAAFGQDLKALEMLLDHGTDVNEAPAERFGRTALQAAALLTPGPAKMAVIHFLLDHGANINADPALQCGVTALQAAAIAGDLMLAELFITRGADVNAWPSFEEGRTAIEGAAEHGRLDMVQLLLNAGARGDVARGTGFERAIELAEKNGHFSVANLLKMAQPSL